jgi:hypothetical protein
MKTFKLLLLPLCLLLAACSDSDNDSKKDQEITFDLLPSVSQGSEYKLTATSSSGLPVSFKSTDPSYAAISGDKLRALKSGSISVIAYQDGNDEYYEAPQIRRLLTITSYDAAKTDQTIAFDLDVTEWKLSQGPLNLTGYATSTSGLPITYTSSRETAAVVDANGELNIVFGIEAQLITIYASQAGNSQYNPATAVGKQLKVVCDLH